MKRSPDTMRKLLRPTRGGSVPPFRRVVIIGGNTLSGGLVGIKYALSVTPLALYDPDIDTSYPDGLGNAWDHLDGIRQANRVLVRHAFTGFTQPLTEGQPMAVVGSVILTFGLDQMVCLTVDFP